MVFQIFFWMKISLDYRVQLTLHSVYILFCICITINNSIFSCFYFLISFHCVNNITRCADNKPYAPIYQVSKEKAKSLGIEFIPLEVSLKETVESLKEKKFIKFNLSP